MFGKDPRPKVFGTRTPLDTTEYTAIKQLEDFVPVILKELHTDILHGRIGGVIGVDTSGRLPALAVSEAIQRLYKGQSLRRPATHFLRGRIQNNKEALASLPGAIAHMHLPKDKKVLVIDDTFATGHSVRPIMAALQKGGYEAQLIVLKSMSPNDMRKSFPGSLDVITTGPLNIYKKRKLTGVKKVDTSKSVYATATRLSPEEHPRDKEKVAAARQLLNEVVKNSMEKYERIIQEKA